MSDHKRYVLKFLVLVLMVTGADLLGAEKVTSARLLAQVTCNMSDFKRADGSLCFQCLSSGMLFYISGCSAKNAVCLQCIKDAKAFFTLAFTYKEDFSVSGIVFRQKFPRCPSCRIPFHSIEELEDLYSVERKKQLVLKGIKGMLSSLRYGELVHLLALLSPEDPDSSLIEIIFDRFVKNSLRSFTDDW